MLTSSRRSTVSSVYARLASVDWRVPATLLLWLVGLWLVSWVAVAASGITPNWIGEPTAAHFNQERDPLSLYVWSRWDGQWYLNIAYGGYGTIPFDAPFFPLYPMLIAGLHAITHLPLAADGLLVSYAFLPLGLFYLYKLARLDFDKDVGVKAIITLLLFPSAFFLVSVYTESLLLFLFCGALYFARQGRWWLVAALAFALGLTKIMAFGLMLALIAEVLLGEANSPLGRKGSTWRDFLSLFKPHAILSKLSPAKITAILAAPAGIFSYMLFLWWRYGDPIAFVSVQRERFWRVKRTFFEQLWYLISSWANRGFSGSDLPKFLDLLVMALLIGLTIYLIKTLRISYAMLIVGFLLVIFMSGDTLSLNRYILQIGPAFIALAALSRSVPRTWVALLAVFVPLQIYFALRFFLWVWVG